MDTGYFYLKNPKFIEEEFENTYNWMTQHMSHLNNKFNAKYPIWVYVCNKYFSQNLEEDKNNIRINLNIPRRHILLSNHTYFENYVLQYRPLSRNKKEAKLHDTLYYVHGEKEYGYYDQCPEVERSWDYIFDLKTKKDSNWDHKFILPPNKCIMVFKTRLGNSLKKEIQEFFKNVKLILEIHTEKGFTKALTNDNGWDTNTPIEIRIQVLNQLKLDLWILITILMIFVCVFLIIIS